MNNFLGFKSLGGDLNKSFGVYVPPLFIIFFLVFAEFATAQEEDERRFLDDFKGTVSVTNNGISLIPSFSLGDPALLFDLKFKKGKFSFEPDMRFALEGKPWTFIFWFRHRLVEKEKFTLRIGAHPAINFRTIPIMRNGQTEDILEARRYLAAEVAPTFNLTENISVGVYYLHGRGFDDGVKQTNFFVLTSTIKNLFFTDRYYLNVTPQAYYLVTDDIDGYYVAGFLTLARKDFPISISSILNKAIATEIAPEDDFTWNISLVYSFP